MEFGTLIFTKAQTVADHVKFAEQCGYGTAWIPDSHMIWGDTYACMALAAVATKKIKLATGVAVASNRIPPVTAHSIATINALAPGRVALGFGTGHTGRRVMGLPPVKLADFRDQIRVICELLRTGESFYATEGRRQKIRFLHREHQFIALEPRIPVYVAANAPQTMQMAGEFGDGIVTTGVSNPDRLDRVLAQVREGARKIGRALPANFPCVSLTHICVLNPGETIESPQVAAVTGHWVMASFHAMAAGYARPESLPSDARDVYRAYVDYLDKLPTPRAERYLTLHEGHCTFVAPAERRFVTPESIRATTMVGRREELKEQLSAMEKAGLTGIFLNPPLEGFKDYLKSTAEALM
jgi:alkanesulfonate monooxygenase SsuD/methylene tetrahydromethanopterin reductase-like flavin-dependent oxidoreductase (luciferase family)